MAKGDWGGREGLEGEIVEALVHRIGKDEHAALPHDWLAATIYTLRDEIIERWMDSSRAAHAAGKKKVYYLSMEFLVDLAEIEEIEPDAALGNGGLGRLAACFMESLASLDIPASATASAM
jgi:starch phosphorylase